MDELVLQLSVHQRHCHSSQRRVSVSQFWIDFTSNGYSGVVTEVEECHGTNPCVSAQGQDCGY